VTNRLLTDMLARRVMGWNTSPNRFLTGQRRWMPRWRFRPDQKLEDAFRLLEAAGPEEYAMGADEPNGFWARVRIAGVTGEARGGSKALAITYAIARASGIEVE
jgi:hypothetical protein